MKIVIVLVVALFVAMGAMRTSNAQVLSCRVDPGNPECVYLYENVGFGGKEWEYLTDTSSLEAAPDNRASSAFNDTQRAVRLYDGEGFTGANICLNSGTGIDNLAVFGLNDKISSMRFVEQC